MKAALAEKLAMDEEEARRREEQVQLKDKYKEVVDAWKNKHKVCVGSHYVPAAMSSTIGVNKNRIVPYSKWQCLHGMRGWSVELGSKTAILNFSVESWIIAGPPHDTL